MTSHYTQTKVRDHTLHDFGGVLGRPRDTFIWALTISWSRLLACGPNLHSRNTRLYIPNHNIRDYTKTIYTKLISTTSCLRHVLGETLILSSHVWRSSTQEFTTSSY